MAESKQVQQIVERAVAQVFERQLPRLQAELVERVLAELPAQEAPAAAATGATPSSLVQSISSIHAGTTQKEILKALLDAGSAHATRIALFVVKAGSASGWQGRGFGEDDTVKDFALDMSAGPVAHSYQNRQVAPANIAEMDQHFVQQFGAPENEQILLLPLVLKEKVAALLYADGGADGLLDAASLEVLVMATSAWLELTSLRKQVQKEVVDSSTMERPPVPPPAPVQAVSSFSDPFASHAPKHIAKPAPEPEPAEVVEVAQAASVSAAASAPAAATDPFAGLSAEDADTHRKAQRFARLLVDEIKLYNQAKVNEGRRNKDLYDRLKEDIDKSRSTFQKRYGNTAAASGDYFQKEVVRSLAEDDLSVMGANFKK